MKRKNTVVMLLVLTIVILVTGIALGQEEGYDLRLNFIPGTEHRLNSYVYQRIEEEIMGHEIALEMFMKTGFKYLVSEKSSGNIYNLTIEYTGLESSLEEFSSDLGIKPEQISSNLVTDSMEETFGLLQDKEFTLRLSDKGEVIEIEGFEQLMEDLLAGVAETNSEVQIDMEKVRNMFGQDFVKQSWGQYFDYIPEGKVRIGESWKSDFNLNQGFPITLTAVYTLKDVTPDEYIIEMKAEINSDGDMGLFETADVNINLKLEGQQTGEIHIDRTTNWLVKMKSNLVINGKMSMAVPGQQQTIEVPMRIRTFSLTN